MIFVTGGTGLLGSHLLFRLTEKNDTIKAIYRSKKKIDTVRKVFQFYDPEHFLGRFEKIKWVECDILDVPSLEEEMTGANQVYHCAALVSFYRRDFYQLMKINREGTANVVNACLTKGVDKLCYVSSTAAIGGEDSIITENTKWKQDASTSGYAISKYSAEKEVWRGIEEGLNAVIVNPCMIIGAGDWNESSMKIFKTIDQGLLFYTSGSNAFVDARDVSEIMLRLMDGNYTSERYMCIGENTKFKPMFDLVAKHLKKKAPSIPVSKLLMKLTWILSGIFSKLIGKRPTVTKETAKSAFADIMYSAGKLKNELNYEFIPLEASIINAVKGKIINI